VGEQGSGTATLSNVPNLLKETSKTYEMKTTTEELCKNSVCFKIRKDEPKYTVSIFVLLMGINGTKH
jgi:hypothetical protein